MNATTQANLQRQRELARLRDEAMQRAKVLRSQAFADFWSRLSNWPNLRLHARATPKRADCAA
jgi:hypothetical protein